MKYKNKTIDLLHIQGAINSKIISFLIRIL